MAEEIELKLALAPGDQRRFFCHPLLRTASAKTDQILDNTYFDTPDLDLRKHGVALRVRKQGRQRLQTVKLAGKARGALTIRSEWETPYRGRFDFSPVEVGTIRQWLESPALAARIGPLFQTRFRRITWHFPLSGGGEILLALDRGTVLAGGREAAISEVELELAGSTDVEALHHLAQQLSARLPLIPATLSKAQRGYDLLNKNTEE
jgi:inorganic triphosphatase YgiF